MVKTCVDKYNDKSEMMEPHFGMFPFPLSDFQKYAIEGIVKKHHVLVTAHTGSGKTLPAEFAIDYFVKSGKKVIYTSPIKALSNQKFHEFKEKFPHISFGILTGDIKFNPDADVLIMTTEILQNTLFTRSKTDLKSNSYCDLLQFNMNLETELACVIFDEVHYINDEDRGKVWEQTMMLLPSSVQMLMLSATIDRPEIFADWIEQQHKSKTNSGDNEVYLIPTTHRVVPLYHHLFVDTTQTIFKSITDQEKKKQITKYIRRPHLIQSSGGAFNDKCYHEMKAYMKLFQQYKCFTKPQHVLNNICMYLKANELLPAICFVFSRKNVVKYAKEITTNILEDDSKIPYTAEKSCQRILRKLPNFSEIILLPEYRELVMLLEKGIAYHHSGLLPVLREMVELMFAEGYVKLLFATETFSVGLNMPTKTVIFTSLSKYTKSGMRMLYSHEYTQMAGRAGRRNLDTEGHVIHCCNMFENSLPSVSEYRHILSGNPQLLKSKLNFTYELILQLLRNDGNINELVSFIQPSMLNMELNNQVTTQQNVIEHLEKKVKRDTESLPDNDSDVMKAYETYLELIYSEKHCSNRNKQKKITKQLNEYRVKYPEIINGTQLELYTQYKTNSKELSFHINYEKSLREHAKTQINILLRILISSGFVKSIPTSDEVDCNTYKYTLTDIGFSASYINELPGLLFVKCCNNTICDELSLSEFLGFISLFIDVKVSDQNKIYNYGQVKFPSLPVKKIIDDTQLFLYDLRMQEERYQISTQQASLELQYDLYDYVILWCKAESEAECMDVLKKLTEEKELFTGDFVKCLLKIMNTVRELTSVYQTNCNIEMLNYLQATQQKLLKFVATNESIYI
mgnify:CR=1 FL=1